MIRENDDQRNYGEVMPENLNEDEIMIHLLIDVSGSMTPYMSWINYLLNQMVSELQNDSMASKSVELAITTFNDDVYHYQEYRPITQVNTINLTAGGGTEIEPAVIDTVNKVKERGHKLEQHMTIRKPMIFMITDGYGGDVTAAAQLVKERVDGNKLTFWTLGVGDYHRDSIMQFHPKGVRWFEAKGEGETDVRDAFKEFFDKVITASAKAVSHSRPNEAPAWENPLNDKNSSLASGYESWLTA